jgi:hypothetical protein
MGEILVVSVCADIRMDYYNYIFLLNRQLFGKPEDEEVANGEDENVNCA